MNASEERSPEVLRELGERRERIRIPLLTLAGSHPSLHIRRLAQQLEVEMANMLHMAGWFVTDLLRSRAPGAAREQAHQHHTARWVCSTSFWTRSASRRRLAGRRRALLAPEGTARP